VRVEVQLFATFARYLPPHQQSGPTLVDVAAGSTVVDVVRALGIPAELSRIVLVNGQEAEETEALHAGDVVTLFPPLAGGGRRG
jgi:molybdopterin converting factor small subunit